MSDFIQKVPAQQPGASVSRRDFTDLVKRVEELSRSLSHKERPHHSSRFLEKNLDGTDIDLTTGSVNLVKHGLNRKYRGWHLANVDAQATVWEDTSGGEDISIYLPLQTSANATVKLVVW